MITADELLHVPTPLYDPPRAQATQYPPDRGDERWCKSCRQWRPVEGFKWSGGWQGKSYRGRVCVSCRQGAK